MRASVVIATSNRAQSLRVTLDALRHQTYDDFEVVVVQGPCEDDTDAVLAERAPHIKVVHNSERNLCKSRNLGIDASAGDVVAFIDDDGIPEPTWLEDLVAGYADEGIGGVGGLVYDQTGVQLQYRYALCDRVGRTDFDRRPPFNAFNRPGADPFVYLQGTNMSFRREALEQIEGFDENIEYIWDETELALHLLDAGWRLLPLDGAPVHHKFLPSNLRRGKGEVFDPYVPVKNRSYFALRNGKGRRPMEEIFRSLTDYVDMLRTGARDGERHGRFTAEETHHFLERLDSGFEVGTRLGLEGKRAGRPLAPRDATEFRPYPVLRPKGKRLGLCFLSLDYPPKPMGGIARYTVDLARGFAEAGHDVHVVTRAEDPYRLDFEEGVWVHRYPEGERHLPSVGDHPLRDNLAHVAAAWRAVDALARRFHVDLVAGNLWLAEALGCALDPRWPTVMTSSTPVRTIAATQPAVADKPEVEWQIKLEDAALRRADQLHPLSDANLEHLRSFGGGAEVPATVIWLGTVDRARGPVPPPARDDDGVEILFVGRLEPRKGIDTLIESALPLLRERPGLRLRIVGSDNPYASEDPRPYAERLADRLSAEPGLRNRITFSGEVTDEELDAAYRGCDIFCAPSRYESFGLINVEAMMFSRPVVSCRAGGIPEVVAEGETGLLVEPDDAAGLREALRQLVDDPALRQRLGAAGRARFEREFDNRIAVGRLLELFEATLERVPGTDVGAEAAEAAVRAGLAEVIDELTDVPRPEAAAAELLEPSAFPHDHLAAVVRLQDGSDTDFVDGLYRAILHREPDASGLRHAVAALASGERSRADIVEDFATSDEARRIGADTGFLERLELVSLAELVRQIRGAFWRDDMTFAATVAGLLLAGHPRDDRDEEAAAVTSRLAAGERRIDVMGDLIARRRLLDRRPGLRAVADEEFLTTEQLRQRLDEIAGADDGAFLHGVYRVLLGRDPDPGGLAGMQHRLAHEPRRAVLVDIAASREATARGIDPWVVDAVAAELPMLDSEPVDGTLNRLRRVGRRVVRDPNVAQLQRSLERHVRTNDVTLDELTRVARESRVAIDALESGATARLTDVDVRTRGLEERLVALEADVAAGRAEQRAAAATAQEWITGIADRVAQMPAEGVHGSYLGRGRMLVRTVWGGKLLTPADDLSLTPDLVAHGIYEAPFTKYLLRHIEHGQTVVDIGANIGMFTVLMAGWVGEEGHVFAFEPSPDVLSVLRENVALNWISDRVTIRPTAVGATAGSMTLHVTERFMANSSLLEPDDAYFSHVPMDTVRRIEVEVEPLDALSAEVDRLDLVKIDVEGAEHLVFEGMLGWFERGAVDRVTFEVYAERMGEAWGDFCERLRAHAASGWTFHLFDEDGTPSEVDLEHVIAVGRFSQVLMQRP